MKTIDRVFVAVHKEDIRLARICVASIRHWYPHIPIYLLKDQASGVFSTQELEEKWAVRIWQTDPKPYGWGFIKLEPLFEKEAGRYLVLDSDIAFIGPLFDKLVQIDADFVVHGEAQSPKAMRDLYFDPSVVRSKIDRSFPDMPFTFNSGQYVATGGLLTRHDFEGVLHWGSPPRLRYPEFFNASDQGVLNYVLLKKLAADSVSVANASFMKWGIAELEELDLAAITSQSRYTALVHWAGMKSARLGAMPRSDILRFFERQYYSRIPGGQARLAGRIVLDAGRRSANRVSRKLRTLLRRTDVVSPALS
jgi:hypothetical protein